MYSRIFKKTVTALALTSSVLAYAYPDKTVTIVVPTAAGGGNCLLYTSDAADE